jgi:hypothetical protein
MRILAFIAVMVVVCGCVGDPNTLASCEGRDTGTRNLCYVHYASEAKDVSLCDNLVDEDSILSCKADVTQVPGLCTNIKNGDQKFYCQAKAKRDFNICGWIVDPDMGQYCILELAISQADKSLCEKIVDDSKRDLCYVNVALTNTDTTVCPQMKDPVMQDYCQKLQFDPQVKEDLLKLLKNKRGY